MGHYTIGASKMKAGATGWKRGTLHKMEAEATGWKRGTLNTRCKQDESRGHWAEA